MGGDDRTAARSRWMALTAALLGWMFDGLEMGLFPLVARPALAELLPGTSEGQIRLKDRVVREPGPDRMMVFQEFDQLLPWKPVRQNVTFALTATINDDVDEAVRKTGNLFDNNDKRTEEGAE